MIDAPQHLFFFPKSNLLIKKVFFGVGVKQKIKHNAQRASGGQMTPHRELESRSHKSISF